MAYSLVQDFEELEVYKKAFQLSLELHKHSLKFPQVEQYALADQIRRASKSICANIAEGFSKQKTSKAEFKRFLIIAMASANEMRVWIKYCLELGYLPEAIAKEYRSEYLSVAKMINRLHSSIK